MKKGFFIFLFFLAISHGFSPICADVGFSVGFYGPNAGVSFSSNPYYSYWDGYGPFYDSPGYWGPYWASPYYYDQPVVVQRVVERREPRYVEQIEQRTWTFANKTSSSITIIAGDSQVTINPGHALRKIPQTRSKTFTVINQNSGEEKTVRSNARNLDIKERNGNLIIQKR